MEHYQIITKAREFLISDCKALQRLKFNATGAEKKELDSFISDREVVIKQLAEIIQTLKPSPTLHQWAKGEREAARNWNPEASKPKG